LCSWLRSPIVGWQVSLGISLVDVGLSFAGNGDETSTISIMLLAAWLGNSSTGFLPSSSS
jgi:hypothetical protein